MATTTFEQQLTDLGSAAVSSLSDTNAATRASALAGLTRQIEDLTLLEQRARTELVARARDEADAAIASASASAETVRRTRATSILADVFSTDPNALVATISAFSAEPGRVLALKIRSLWDASNARALTELGVPLSHEVLGAAFVDSLIARSDTSVLYALSQPDFGSLTLLYRLEAATKADMPADVEAALVDVDRLVTQQGALGSGTTATADALARHALRKANATRADVVDARAAVEATIKKRDDAAFATSYQGPSATLPASPRLSDLVREVFGLA